MAAFSSNVHQSYKEMKSGKEEIGETARGKVKEENAFRRFSTTDATDKQQEADQGDVQASDVQHGSTGQVGELQGPPALQFEGIPEPAIELIAAADSANLDSECLVAIDA